MVSMGIEHGAGGEQRISVDYKYRGRTITQYENQVLVFENCAMVQSFEGGDLDQLTDAMRFIDQRVN